MVTCTALSLAALRRPPHVQAISLAVVASAPLLVGHVFVERFDVWPAALTAAALAAALRGRYALGGAALGLGAAAKVYPALLLPVLVIVAVRQRGVRAAIASAAAAVVTSVLVFPPFAVVGWAETLATLRHQTGGGAPVERERDSVLGLS